MASHSNFAIIGGGDGLGGGGVRGRGEGDEKE